MQRSPVTVQAFCARLLARGDLATKLAAPGELRDAPAEGIRPPLRPARDSGLAMASGAARLPPPGALRDPAARAAALARFAHHELQAAELFAWALLRWPEAPAGLRRGWLRVLGDEQRHAALYLERLAALSARFADFAPHSDYFWKHAPVLDAAEAGPAAFLAAMGLTLEQANLDFAALYREAFLAAGDPASARACERVHEDEVRHVALAARWLRVLCPGADSDRARYEASVPFPFAAARAKGRRFDAAARRRAGLDDAFVEHVRAARSSQERRGGSGSTGTGGGR